MVREEGWGMSEKEGQEVLGMRDEERTCKEIQKNTKGEGESSIEGMSEESGYGEERGLEERLCVEG